jgi:formylglycine-generating enzyme required for sulfatase activity
MKSRWVKGALTVVGAVTFSTLGIFASDALRGIDPGAGNLASVRNVGTCKEGSAPLKINGNTVCVDLYEASPGEGCPYPRPASSLETERNATAEGCYAASVSGVGPWTYVSLPQAQRMCSGAGKRLPTGEEWYRIALGTDAGGCTVSSNTAEATGNDTCISDLGAYDAIGNVWEWVDETVVNGSYDERPLPEEGYVTSVDADGVAVTSGEAPDGLYGADYVWTKFDGVFGMIRGGYYDSGEDAGLYTVNASIPTSFATQGIGFRCVEDVL